MNSKKLIGLLFIGYSLLGLRLAGANDLQLPIDTTENGGVRAEASLVEAVRYGRKEHCGSDKTER